MIAHLKDQLQEMKAKASMEGKYIRKDADVRVSITQKICQQSEDSLKQELEVRKIFNFAYFYRQRQTISMIYHNRYDE